MSLELSGERFTIVYQLPGPYEAALQEAENICLEQTVELPSDLIPEGPIRSEIVGKVEKLTETAKERFEARISFSVETSAFELSQLLNIAFGNISIKPGIRLLCFELPDSLLSVFRGPRFGCSGLREIIKVWDRPLLGSALKPMGLSASEMADLAGRLALGGIDIIKDDHGLTNQPFCRFQERVAACANAVEQANRQTGFHSIYLAHVTASPEVMFRRALFAKEAGAGGLLICPGLAGFEAMRALADDDTVALPIMKHPAFLGSFVVSQGSGVSHGALYGQLGRLAGADATIFPSWGGRFSFDREQCRDISRAASDAMGPIKPIFTTPAGGMGFERIADMAAVYGKDCIYLIGGALLRHGPDLVEACRTFRKAVEKTCTHP